MARRRGTRRERARADRHGTHRAPARGHGHRGNRRTLTAGTGAADHHAEPPHPRSRTIPCVCRGVIVHDGSRAVGAGGPGVRRCPDSDAGRSGGEPTFWPARSCTIYVTETGSPARSARLRRARRPARPAPSARPPKDPPPAPARRCPYRHTKAVGSKQQATTPVPRAGGTRAGLVRTRGSGPWNRGRADGPAWAEPSAGGMPC